MQTKKQLVDAFSEIQQTLAEMHTFFEHDSEDVQREWVKFTVKVRHGSGGQGTLCA